MQREEAVLEIKTYPNPVNAGSLLVIERSIGSYAGSINFSLISLNGNRVSSGNYDRFPQQIMVDTNGLLPGVYLLKITSEQGKSVSKRIIIR